jgi:hypothetical protein
MFEFRVQLFPLERPKGLLGSLKSILRRLRKPKRDDILDLKIGSPTEYGYNCVDVYYRDAKIGEIRKKGIDEMIEKGAFAGARYYDEGRITISRLEAYEYQHTPEYEDAVQSSSN